MLAAMVLIAASFGAMVAAAQAENHTVTTIALEALPEGASLETLDGGRLHFDAARRELTVRGVLPPFVVTSALEAVASPSYREQLAKMPDADAQTKGRLLRETTPPVYAQALDALSTKSDQARVGGTWLLLSYFLATLGELCLSPVGLSMVTKLAPTRFASLLMGVWMLGSSVAQYVGGSLGESWGKIAPTELFHHIRLDVMRRRIGAGTPGRSSQAAHARRRALGDVPSSSERKARLGDAACCTGRRRTTPRDRAERPEALLAKNADQRGSRLAVTFLSWRYSL